MVDFGKETTFTALGKRWTFGRLELRAIEEIRDWIAEQVGDPFALVDRFIDKVPREDGLKMLAEAKAVADDLRNFSLQSDLAKKWIGTERGAAVLVASLLRANHPDIDHATAFLILQEIGAAELEKAVNRGTGKVPGAPKNG